MLSEDDSHSALAEQLLDACVGVSLPGNEAEELRAGILAAYADRRRSLETSLKCLRDECASNEALCREETEKGDAARLGRAFYALVVLEKEGKERCCELVSKWAGEERGEGTMDTNLAAVMALLGLGELEKEVEFAKRGANAIFLKRLSKAGL